MAVADAVDFQSDLLSSPVPGSLLLEEGSPCIGSVIVETTTFVEELIRGEKTGRVLPPHCWVSQYRSMGQQCDPGIPGGRFFPF